MTKAQMLIAATSSGCGKTTFTLGLLRALRNRGLCASSFKCGPDYIDPKYHSLASGQSSINLDPYMMSREHIREVYQRYSSEAQAVVVEGVMGLFDGYDRMQGSSASIASELQIPVILLVNAASSAYSVGATIYGFSHFRPEVKIAGVVFNRVASENHYHYLCDAAEDAGVPVLGYIPKSSLLEVPSRHLGLSLEELDALDAFPAQVAELIEAHVDLDRLLELCQCPIPSFATELTPRLQPEQGMRIAVAQDEAFNFTYPENLRRLAQLGEVIPFSPMRSLHLPPETTMIYLPGGYPEFYLEALERNQGLRQEIAAFAKDGGRILAECGGMMYLCREIKDQTGKAYQMCGVLEATATMQEMKLALGYRHFELGGKDWRGHEFHYSHLEGEQGLKSSVVQYNLRGAAVPTGLYRNHNVVAGYTHLYWAEANPLDLFTPSC
ncbi:cobyrinate a,c-diamide synthase [Porphyromonas sp. COT-239 OH1446]|uniref:cobyrinate a,c-diamide synthase n=1 Tax=Porphyromonas sp. COT-239 OH1446 TaxID=1515613 RepID=UPI00052BAB12|nr:cobyrinate a,c-diamide synthase [Porphyromonas sp. COT-239 OH1446]KGN72082.1 cobyrinic acid a,c-diamide synthase [Porphyromonas sp. COT-239 OH1446]